MILTGWAGQVSLGQMGFVAIGGALGAKATTDWGLDLALVIPLIGFAGALVAVVVGLPALRLRGLYLAVTTLAFALATVNYILNPQFFGWIPTQPFEPEPILGIWDYGATTEGMYQLCLIVFVLCAVAIVGIRKSRTGRVLVALRENERGARAYGVSAVGAKLTAFAISGFFASIAGVVLVQVNGQFTLGLFPPEENLITFTAAVVGGLGSVLGAVLGAIFLKGGQWFLSDRLAPARVGHRRARSSCSCCPAGSAARSTGCATSGCVRSRAGGASSCRACSPTSRPTATVDAAVPDMAEPAPVAHEEVPDAGRRGRCRVIPMLPQPTSDAPWYQRTATGFRHPIQWLEGLTGDGPVRPLLILFGLNAVDELAAHVVLRHRADHRRRLRRRHRGRHHPVRARVRRRARAVGPDRQRRRPRQPRPHRAARRPRVRRLLDCSSASR